MTRPLPCTTSPRPHVRPRLLALLGGFLPVLALSACTTAGRDRFPSLERRPAERAFGTAQPVTPAPAPDGAVMPAPDADLVTRVAALREQARKAGALFDSKRPAAARAVAAAHGAAVASDSWSIAQVALAELDSARSQGMVAMSDLDRLLIEASQRAAIGPNDGPAAGDLATVRAAQAEVSGWIADEDNALDGLRNQIRG